MQLRDLPKVDVLARDPRLDEYPETVRTAAAREAIDGAREQLLAGEKPDQDLGESAVRAAERRMGFTLRSAVNLTGVVLHTGLGRARLAPSVARHVAEVAADYSNLELDLETGERGDRQSHVRSMLCELTGAEDAHVVNNAAAGVVLALSALASGREVILSRGEMVEIGGAFRMPDIVRQSGCRLVEVGCTNRTRVSDYEQAITPETGAILRCHPSNYRIVGFAESASPSDLRRVADETGVVLIDDQGSGCLLDLTTLGLPAASTLPSSVRWADVAVASGDKLLGAAQAGILVGKAEAIARVRRHPLARAFRIDKLCLAALEATLRLWATGREEEIPTVRYLRRPLEEVQAVAHRLAQAWPGATVEAGQSEVGSGSVPGHGLPTFRVGLTGDAVAVARALRIGSPPVVGRIEKDRVWLDPRTLDEEEFALVERRLREVAG